MVYSPGLVISLLLMFVCGAFFYKVGETEHASGIPLAVVSVLLWLGATFGLGWGILGCILVQAGLFAILTAWNILRDKRG